MSLTISAYADTCINMETVAHFFKALSEPARLRIMNLLLNGERCVCELMAVLDMPQSTVSRHLSYLKNAGLISGRRQGLWMYYSMAEPKTELHADLLSFIKTHFPQMEQSGKDIAALELHDSSQDRRPC